MARKTSRAAVALPANSIVPDQSNTCPHVETNLQILLPCPAVERLQSDTLRALTMMDAIPAGHIGVPVFNTDWEPHLHPGEFAVLDTTDTEPVFGGLYGLMIGMARPRLTIVQPYRSTTFRDPDAVMYRFSAHRPGVLHYVDGPLMMKWWHVKCRGRVVGVMAPPAGGWNV